MSRPVRRALERKPAFTADVLPKETRFSIEVVGEPDKVSSVPLPYLLHAGNTTTSGARG